MKVTIMIFVALATVVVADRISSDEEVQTLRKDMSILSRAYKQKQVKLEKRIVKLQKEMADQQKAGSHNAIEQLKKDMDVLSVAYRTKKRELSELENDEQSDMLKDYKEKKHKEIQSDMSTLSKVYEEKQVELAKRITADQAAKREDTSKKAREQLEKDFLTGTKSTWIGTVEATENPLTGSNWHFTNSKRAVNKEGHGPYTPRKREVNKEGHGPYTPRKREVNKEDALKDPRPTHNLLIQATQNPQTGETVTNPTVDPLYDSDHEAARKPKLILRDPKKQLNKQERDGATAAGSKSYIPGPIPGVVAGATGGTTTTTTHKIPKCKGPFVNKIKKQKIQDCMAEIIVSLQQRIEHLESHMTHIDIDVYKRGEKEKARKFESEKRDQSQKAKKVARMK